MWHATAFYITGHPWLLHAASRGVPDQARAEGKHWLLFGVDDRPTPDQVLLFVDEPRVPLSEQGTEPRLSPD